MPKTVTTRLPDKYLAGINEIAEEENLDTSTTIRRLLANAIAEWKKEHAIELYKKGEFSLEQSARFADINVWEFFDLLKQKKVQITYDAEELEAELKALQ